MKTLALALLLTVTSVSVNAASTEECTKQSEFASKIMEYRQDVDGDMAELFKTLEEGSIAKGTESAKVMATKGKSLAIEAFQEIRFSGLPKLQKMAISKFKNKAFLACITK